MRKCLSLLVLGFFTVRVVRHGNKVPREVVRWLDRGSVQSQARWGLEHPLRDCVPTPGPGGWNRRIFKLCSYPFPFCGAVKALIPSRRVAGRSAGGAGTGAAPPQGARAMRGPALPLARRAGAALGPGRAAGRDLGQVRWGRGWRGRGWSRGRRDRAGAGAGAGPEARWESGGRFLRGLCERNEPARPGCAPRVPPPHPLGVCTSLHTPWVFAPPSTPPGFPYPLWAAALAQKENSRPWSDASVRAAVPAPPLEGARWDGTVLDALREGKSAFSLGVCIETKSSFPASRRLNSIRIPGATGLSAQWIWRGIY